MEIISLLVGIIYLTIVVVHYYLFTNTKRFEISRTVKLNKELVIQLYDQKDEDFSAILGSKLLKDGKIIDKNICEYREFLFAHYFIGNEGFYILNKLNKRLVFKQKTNEFNRQQEKRFNTYFYDI